MQSCFRREGIHSADGDDDLLQRVHGDFVGLPLVLRQGATEIRSMVSLSFPRPLLGSPQ